MGTKINSNYSDLLTFTRASKGHALRPVSYGDNELPSASFTVVSNGTWDGTQFVDTVGSQVRPGVTSGTALTNGTTYALFINITNITGATQVRVDGLDGTDRLLGEGDHRISFASNGGTPRVRLEDTSTSVNDGFTLQNALTAKEVLFDQPDGTLTLFEHPDNVPRVEWDADRNRLGLLVEESRTNLVTYSEDFSQWTGFSDPNEILAPDGTLTATKARDNNQGTSAAVQLNEPVTVSTSTTYTYSVFGKKGQLNWMALGIINFTTPSNGRVWFDLDNGVVGTQGSGLSGAIEEFPNGWYRCSVTFTTDATDTSGQLYIYLCEDDGQFVNTNRDGTSDLYVWGAQLEAGSFPTSYMKNEGTVSGKDRSADVAKIPVADFGYNHDASTFIVEASELGGLDSNLQRHTLFSTETASALRLYVGKSGGGGGSGDEIYVGEGASNTYFELGDITQNTFYKVGVVVETDDISASLNGGAIASDSSVALAKDETKIGIGSRTYSGTNIFNGHIKSIKYYPRRLSDAQLVELTS